MSMKRSHFLLVAALAAVWLLNSATIRRKPDPILKTQAEPISYAQKLEETKDGVKGAPTPSFKLFPKENFMADPAVGAVKEETSQELSSGEENVSEVAVSEGTESEEWWGDEEKKEDPSAPAGTSNNKEEDQTL